MTYYDSDEQGDRMACGETAADGTRTHDLRFTKPLLYQLSYGGELMRF